MKKTPKPMARAKPISKAFKLPLVQRNASPDPAANIAEIRNLGRMISGLQTAVEALLRQQGNFIKDLQEMRRDMFFSGLQDGMKNRKKLKKEFESRTDRLLEKCGIKKKGILSADDVERLKSRDVLGTDDVDEIQKKQERKRC